MKRPDLAKFHNNMLQLTSTNYVRHISAYFVWSFCSLVVSGLRSGRSQDDHLANSTDCCVSNFDNSHRFAHITNVKHVFNVFADFFHILTFPAKKHVEAMTNPGSAFAVTRMACTLSRPTRPSSWPGPEATLRTCWWSFVIIRHQSSV